MLNMGWAESQMAGDFFSVPEDVPAPVFLLRNPKDEQFCTSRFEVHYYKNRATGQNVPIPCGRSIGRPCPLCEDRERLYANNDYHSLDDQIRELYRASSRHMAFLVDVRPFRHLLQNPQALLEALSKAKPLKWGFGKTVYQQLFQKIQATTSRYGQLIDPTDYKAAKLLWLQKIKKAGNNRQYMDTNVEFQFDATFVLPDTLVMGVPLFGEVFSDETDMSAWPEERIREVSQNGIALSAVAGGPQRPQIGQGQWAPPQITQQPQPAPQFYQPPAPQQTMQMTQPSTTAAPGLGQYQVQTAQPPIQVQYSHAPVSPSPEAAAAYAIPTPAPQPPTPGATVSAAIPMACFGSDFSASSEKCAKCAAETRTRCMGEVMNRMSQAGAPAAATPPTPPPVAGNVPKSREEILKMIEAAKAKQLGGK